MTDTFAGKRIVLNVKRWRLQCPAVEGPGKRQRVSWGSQPGVLQAVCAKVLLKIFNPAARATTRSNR